MSLPRTCPPPEQLRDLIDGRLAPGGIVQLADHVVVCASCCRALGLLAGPRLSEWQGSSLSSLRTLAARIEAQANDDVTIGVEGSHHAAPAPSPRQYGHYRIIRELGAGGMGVVFEAEDTLLHRRVALKVLRPEIAAVSAARERFLREARLAASLMHPHVVVLHEVGEVDGALFMAMELLEGESLATRLKRGPLSTSEVVRLGREIADGLAAFHALGVIHRDITPANVWLDPKAGVKLLDFGLARLVSDPGHLTQSGTILGTPAYMSPEQARGQKVDARADLFSLGGVLYESATGRRPFTGEDTFSLLTALAVDHPLAPAQVANVPAALSDLIMRLLSKSPEKRPSSAVEVERALAAIDTTTRPRRARRWLAAGIAVLLLVGISAVVFFMTRPKSDSKDPANGGPEVAKSPLDALDPESIPNGERFGWQPPELVAVIGKHGGHWGVAWDGVISPDGKWLATAGQDRAIKLFELPGMTERSSLVESGPLPISTLFWGPAGDRLYYASDRIRFAEVKDGVLKAGKKFDTPEEWLPHRIAIREDKVLFGCGRDVIRAWAVNGTETKLLWQRQTSAAPHNHATFDRTFTRLAYLRAADRVIVLDVSGEKPKTIHELDVPGARSVVLSPDGKELAVGVRSGEVRRWDLREETPRERKELPSSGDEVDVLGYSPDGKRLAVGPGAAHVWDLTGEQARLIATLPRHGVMNRLNFSSSGDHLTRISTSGFVQYWDLTSKPPRECGRALEPTRYLTGTFFNRGPRLQFTPDGSHLCSQVMGGHRVWKFGQAAPQEWGEVIAGDRPLALHPDGGSFFGGNDQIQQWKLTATGIEPGRQYRRVPPYLHLTFLTDGRSALLSGHDMKVRLWDRESEALTEWRGVSGWYQVIPLTPDGRRLLSPAVGHQVIRVYESSASGWVAQELIQPGFVEDIALSSDRNSLAVATRSAATLFDMTQTPPRKRWQSDTSIYYGVAFSPDNKHFATSRLFGVVSIRETSTGKAIREWTLPGCVYRVAYAPDGRHLVTLNGNGTAYVLRLFNPDGSTYRPKE